MSLLLLFNAPSSVVPAYLRADADSVNTDNWVTQAGSSTGLFDVVNETSLDDADYIQSPAEAGYGSNTVRFQLSDPTAGKTLVDPLRVRYRFRKTNTGDKTLSVTLKQGTTVIANWSHTGAGITTSLQTVTQTLTAPQVAAITDLSNLFIEFVDSEV